MLNEGESNLDLGYRDKKILKDISSYKPLTIISNIERYLEFDFLNFLFIRNCLKYTLEWLRGFSLVEEVNGGFGLHFLFINFIFGGTKQQQQNNLTH